MYNQLIHMQVQWHTQRIYMRIWEKTYSNSLQPCQQERRQISLHLFKFSWFKFIRTAFTRSLFLALVLQNNPFIVWRTHSTSYIYTILHRIIEMIENSKSAEINDIPKILTMVANTYSYQCPKLQASNFSVQRLRILSWNPPLQEEFAF